MNFYIEFLLCLAKNAIRALWLAKIPSKRNGSMLLELGGSLF
jgi:hypothetical protein